MSFRAIHEWLVVKGQFNLGVQLLQTHGQLTTTQEFLFKTGETAFSRRKLTEALQALHTQAVAATPRAPVLRQIPVERDKTHAAAFTRGLSADAGTDLPEQSLPPQLRPLRGELRDMHRLMVFLRGTMTRIPDGMELRKVAEQVVDLRTRINAGWLTIETYRATGQLVQPAPSKETKDSGELRRELASLRVQISKAKHGKRKASEEQMTIWIARRDTIQRLLNGPGATA